MVKLLQQNKAYFYTLAICWLLGLIAWVQFDKGQDILFFSRHRSIAADWFFSEFTKVAEISAFVFVVLAMLLIRIRYAIILAIAGLLTLFSSFGLKQWFSQPRPKSYFEALHRLDEIQWVPDVYVNASPTTSFPSGHTFSAFVLFGFLAFITRPRAGKIGWLSCAILVAISRIYLVQHFLADVLAGAAFGTALISLLYILQLQIRWSNWTERSIFSLAKPQRNNR